MALVELDESNFAETIRDNKGLAVVEFWAPWCRLCKAIAPTLDKEVAKLEAQAEYANVTFYKVNFKENQRLAFRERVAALPTLHFYGPFASRRINRFTVKPTTVAKQLRKELDRYCGASGHLALLQSLSSKPAPLSPLTRFSLLTGFLTAVMNVDEYMGGSTTTAKEMVQAISTDERRLGELEDLFNWVDANGDGYIEADELAAVAAAVGTFEDGPESGAPSESFFAGLLEHAQQIASKGSKRGSGAPMALDFEAFLRIMTSKAVAEYKVPETELELAFVALDVDGDGEISKAEFLAAMESVRASLSSSGVWSFTEQDMEDAFAAADRDHTGTIDYEEFVSVMSDMTVAKIVPK